MTTPAWAADGALCATVYQHDNATGAHLDLSEDSYWPDLRNNIMTGSTSWNDQITSFLVHADHQPGTWPYDFFCRLDTYTDINYNGAYNWYLSGSQTDRYYSLNNSLNDNFSSLYCGCRGELAP